MLHIDGAMGEGGGQVLRSALTLSILTGQSIQVVNIRAGRAKPGLQPQHVQAVNAAAAICGGHALGTEQNSQELVFTPGEIHPGRYRFDIGTAGSAALVLQTIYLPLARAGDSSTITITGGTHVPFSPSYHYLERQWLPVLEQLGFWMRLSLARAGFYPQGGGEIQAMIRPLKNLQPLQRMERGALQRIRGITASANLDENIARRQKLQALRRLQPLCADSKIETLQLPSQGKGTMLMLQALFEQSTCCYSALGAPGKRAEAVADEAVDALLAFLETDGAVDEYLADQLLLPLSFCQGISQFRTARVTRHLLTNAQLIPLFQQVKIDVQGAEGAPGTVTVSPQDS